MQADAASVGANPRNRLDRALAEGAPPDIAQLDMSLPEQNGLQLAKALRTYPAASAVKVVILTSLNEPRHAEQARKAGFTACLTKPVRHDHLQACLRTALGLADGPIQSGHVPLRPTVEPPVLRHAEPRPFHQL
jgi:CheY-like chemotaxis protein